MTALTSTNKRIRLKCKQKHTHLLTLYVVNSLLVSFLIITLSELSCQTHKVFYWHSFYNPCHLHCQRLHNRCQHLHLHSHFHHHRWCSIINLVIIIYLTKDHNLQSRREVESWLKWPASHIEWLMEKHYATLLSSLHVIYIRLICNTRLGLMRVKIVINVQLRHLR